MRNILDIANSPSRRKTQVSPVGYSHAANKFIRSKRSYLSRSTIGFTPSIARDTGGFTLIELTVVIIMVSLFAAFTIPKIGDLGAMKLKSEGRQIARIITYMHTQAGASQKLLRLSFNIKSGKYFVSFLNSKGQFEKTTLSLFSETKLGRGIHIEKFTTLFGGVSIGDEPSLHFLAEGFTEKAVIVLADKKNRKLSLIVDPLTGKVKIKKGEAKFEYLQIEANNMGATVETVQSNHSWREAV